MLGHFVTCIIKGGYGAPTQSNCALCVGQDPDTFERGISHSTVAVIEHSAISMTVQTILPQSAETFNVTTGSTTTVSENVEFMDTNPAFNVNVASSDDPTRGIADMADSDLGQFLSRPILIREYTWSPSLAFFETFDPWSLFLNQARNINRIANFNLFRSKLCVKFLVNGNGFYYGRLMATYNPLPATDEVTLNRGLLLDADNIGASQRPHLYINPTECQGGDMCLPFVHWQNTVKIPTAQWSDFGEMTIRTLSDLKNANGATDGITVSVFAYLENPNMAIPTSKNPITITPQSDEYGSNPISGPASTVARVSGMLTSVPMIAPFAKATQLAAGAVGGIAKLFGMSRPAVIDPIQVYRPEYMGGMANTNTPDGTNKLSMDVKQELTIDSSVVGVDSTDEMGLVPIAKRESYYTSFNWDPAGGVRSGPGYRLFTTQVMPTIYQSLKLGANAPTEYHMTPAGYVALPFDYWGGSMEFRFQVVASNFHRGRIRVVWDPASLDAAGNGDYNTSYNRIIDITDMKDFTIKVGWGREYSFLPVQPPNVLLDGLPIPSYEPQPSGLIIPDILGNGILSVYVVNDLTVPNTDPGLDNSIEVNVFSRMCDDARFAQPTEMRKRSVSYFRPPDSTAVTISPQSAEMEEQEMAPVSTGADTTVADDQPVADHMMDVFFGEEITSIRQMLKRYCFHSFMPLTMGEEGVRSRMYEVTSPDFPCYNGYNPGSDSSGTYGSTSYPFSYTQCTYLNYFAPAFVAYRGGVRWKKLAHRAGGANLTDYYGEHFSVTRSSGVSGTNSTVPGSGSAANAYDPYSRAESLNPLRYRDTTTRASSFMSSYTVGGFLTPVDRNPACEVDLPFYSNRRFMCARRIKNLEKRQLDDEMPPVHVTTTIGRFSATENFVAAAEDFSLSFFIGVPVMYSVGTLGEYSIPPIVAT